MATFDDVFPDLVISVTKETTDTGSLIALINGFTQQLIDAVNAAKQLTPEQLAAIESVRSAMDSNDQAVADALAANVPTP